MHYLFGEKIDLDPSFVIRAYSSPNIVAVWTVSASDYSYALDMLPVPPCRIHRIVNAIEDNLFAFCFSHSKSIAYMPRKNFSHSHVFVELVKSQAWFQNSCWSFVPIVNKSLSDVSSILSSSSLFLSFGYPEGFGLPLAEAIASGCMVVGYDGIGGREISDLCKPFDVFIPVPFRDFHLFSKCLHNAIDSYDLSVSSSLEFRLAEASRLILSRYSKQSMVDSVKLAIEHIAS